MLQSIARHTTQASSSRLSAYKVRTRNSLYKIGSMNVRFTPKTTELVRWRDMWRWAYRKYHP